MKNWTKIAELSTWDNDSIFLLAVLNLGETLKITCASVQFNTFQENVINKIHLFCSYFIIALISHCSLSLVIYINQINSSVEGEEKGSHNTVFWKAWGAALRTVYLDGSAEYQNMFIILQMWRYYTDLGS